MVAENNSNPLQKGKDKPRRKYEVYTWELGEVPSQEEKDNVTKTKQNTHNF